MPNATLTYNVPELEALVRADVERRGWVFLTPARLAVQGVQGATDAPTPGAVTVAVGVRLPEPDGRPRSAAAASAPHLSPPLRQWSPRTPRDWRYAAACARRYGGLDPRRADILAEHAHGIALTELADRYHLSLSRIRQLAIDAAARAIRARHGARHPGRTPV